MAKRRLHQEHIKAKAIAVVVSLGLISAVSTWGQETVDKEMIAKIRDEGLMRSKVGGLFETLTTVFGPRLTGSPSFRRAAEWARATLAEWGLQNPRLEAWEFGRGWTLERFTLELTEPRYMPLIGYPEAWSPSTPGEIIADPLFVGELTPEEIEQLQAGLKGAIVLTQPVVTTFIRQDRPQPTDMAQPESQLSSSAPSVSATVSPTTRLAGDWAQRVNRALQAAGVAVWLQPSRGEHGTLFVSGRDQGDSPITRVVVAGEHYNMLVRMLQQRQPVKVRVNVQSVFHDQDRSAYNVLAELPGVDPAPAVRDQVVMLGAHLDSWHAATGATDNADGSAVAMEAMRILKVVSIRPRRTIRLALWGGEEQGLLGSRQYVNRYLAGDTHKADRERLSVYFNIDPGTGPIYGFYLENQESVRPIFDAWLEPFRDLGALRNVLRGIGSTDHVSFRAVGVPGFNPVQDYMGYDVRTHHTNMDTAERVNVADLRQAAVVLASFVYHAAMRPERIPRPGP